MNNNYLIIYNTKYFLDEQIKKATSKDFKNININEYDLEENTLSDVLEDLDTYSLLSEKKVILVKHIELIEDNATTKHLFRYLDNPSNDNILILSSTKFNLTKKINKELKKKTNFIKEEELDITKQIKLLLDGYSIETGVINKLIEYSNNNIDIIKTECEKLKNYKIEDKKITKDDVETLVVKHLGDSNKIVFDLIRLISMKDKKNALLKYNSLEKYNIDDMSLIGLLESQLRLMIQVSLYLDKHLSKKEIAEKLNAHPFRIEKTIELLTYSNKKDIAKLIKDLSNLDYKMKSGIIDSNKAMFTYILNI